MNHILFINNSNYYNNLQQDLSHSGFLVTAATTFIDAQNLYEKMTFDIIIFITDGVDKSIKKKIDFFTPCPLIALDEAPNTSTEKKLKLSGVNTYLPLTIESHLLLEEIIRLLEQKHQLTNRKKNKNDVSPIGNIVGNSDAMKQLFKDVKKIAYTDVTVLIRGESGSGKELIAKAIHKLSPRNKEALISINCAAIPESLIESELFGHEKGAFTGATSARDGLIAAANKGTLFLDEIGELPLEAQARLLRFLQEGEIRKIGAVQATTVNVRILTATHRDLSKMVREGLFREDLYYRLYVMELLLPPLRERGSDVSLIAQHIVSKMCKKHQRQNLVYTTEFNQAILEHSWPGNVRELENAIERAVILSNGEKLDPSTLKLQTQRLQKSPLQDNQSAPNHAPMRGTTLDDYLTYFVANNQNKMTETQIAQHLGISRKSLWERRQKLNIKKKSNT